MNILSIDGGGIRGIYSAFLLKRIHDEFSVDFVRQFDLIAGTSTGSIIAAALATGIPIGDVVKLYEDHGSAIFPRSWWTPKIWRKTRKVFGSSYKNAALKAILADKFGEKTLSETETNLILPATNIGDGAVHVLKSAYDVTFVRDPNVKIADAVLASCSAPTFFDPHKIGPYMLADGGLWANNPTLVAIVDAKRRLGANLDDMRVLSIGTGSEDFAYSQKQSWWSWLSQYGVAWWGPKKLIDLLLSLQAQASANMSFLLLQDRYLRINFKGEGLALDDPKSIPDLKSKADMNFTYKSEQIRQFLDNLPARKERL
jgi:patatin-like phospholipase/acyl hydrolase